MSSKRLHLKVVRLAASTLLWCLLVAWVHASGRTAHGVPVLADFYYGLQVVFLPWVVYAQWHIGRYILSRGWNAQQPDQVSADALFWPMLVLVVGDSMLMSVSMLGRYFFLPQALAALVAWGVLFRDTRSVGASLSTWFAQLIPALLFIR